MLCEVPYKRKKSENKKIFGHIQSKLDSNIFTYVQSIYKSNNTTRVLYTE